MSFTKSLARPAYRSLGRLGHRLSHPWRRRRALSAVRSAGVPGTIIFICYGNICRSPYAAYSLRRRLAPRRAELIRVVSAGSYGPGRSSPGNALAAAAALGVDLGPHRSQLLTQELVRSANLIVGMEGSHRRAVLTMFGRLRAPLVLPGDLDPDAFAPPMIADPYGGSRENFAETYVRIDQYLEELAKHLVARLSMEPHRYSPRRDDRATISYSPGRVTCQILG